MFHWAQKYAVSCGNKVTVPRPRNYVWSYFLFGIHVPCGYPHFNIWLAGFLDYSQSASCVTSIFKI